MCGIVGSASTEKMKSRSERYSFMKVGLDLDSWRGWESTGIACVPEAEKDSPIVYKRAINGRDFINCKETERLLSDIEKYPVVIGHNRAATTGRGNIVDHNAHPFQYGKITLVHNGHIRNCHELGDANKGADCAVDSAQVAYAMESMGEKETLEACEGGFCFVWWNSKTRLLNIARNNERPMHWAYAAKENTLYFASEPTQLLHLLRDVEIDEDKGILFPEPWVWYQFNLKDLREIVKVPFVHRQGRHQKNIASDQSGRNLGGGNLPTEAEIAAWEAVADHTRGTTTRESMSELDEIRKDVANTRLKEAKACGVPTTEKRMERAKAELGRMGFTYQEFRVCTPDSWVKYKNQDNLGAVIARTRREGHIVEIGAVRFQDYEKFRRIKTVMVEVVNVRNGAVGNEKRLVAILSPRMKQYLSRREAQIEEEEKRAQAATSIDLICRGPHNQMISLARWYELTDSGCSSCTCDLFAKDCDEVTWVQEFPLCGSCTKDPRVMELLGVPEHGRASGVH